MAIRPSELIFRCYAYEARQEDLELLAGQGPWRAVCIDLDLWASGRAYEDVRRNLDRAIQEYIEAVMDTADPDSIPHLLRRRAPLRYIIRYHWLGIRAWFHRGPGDTSRGYESVTPFHIGTAPA